MMVVDKKQNISLRMGNGVVVRVIINVQLIRIKIVDRIREKRRK